MNSASLCASELKYRRLFETARDGIIIVDPATRSITDVNPFMIELLGYSRADFVGRELFEMGLLENGEASRVAFGELQRTGFMRYDCLPLQTRDGRRVEVEFVGSLYDEGGRQTIQCNIRDIADRKRAEAGLRDADQKLSQHALELEDVVSLRTAELQASNAQLQMLVYSIAHDLRAPLRAMQGFSQLLVQDHAPRLDGEGREYANFINEAAQNMDRLLADLLAFSQLSQQKLELEPLALETVVASVVSGCSAEILASRARVDISGPWPWVNAHETVLRQVLVNLIGNAMKFVSGRLPEIRVYAEDRPGGIVRIWVADNGIGIASEFHDRIFKVFERLHSTSYPGTGIGLAIVQKGLERMGGRVGVVSTLGEGSRFWIELARTASPAIAGGKPVL